MPAALESASRPKLSVNKQSQPPVKAIPAQWESNPQNGLERYLARATSIPWWRQEVSAARGTQPALPPHPCPAQLSNPWGGALGSDRLHSMSCVPEQGPTSLLSPLVTGAVGVGREPHTEHVTKGTFAVMGVAAETGIAGCRALGIALHADSTWSPQETWPLVLATHHRLSASSLDNPICLSTGQRIVPE